MLANQRISSLRISSVARSTSRASSVSIMLWKPVPGFHDYEVSEYGDLRRNGIDLKPFRLPKSGRKVFCLSKGGIQKRMHAAHVVILAFVGPKPFEGAFVCHNDGFEHNNHYSNLRWDSHQGNVADKRMQVARRQADRYAYGKRKLLAAEASRLLSTR